MGSRARTTLVIACAAYTLAFLAIYGSGVYGWALFVGVPLFIGFATTSLLALNRPHSFAESFWWSVLTGTVIATMFVATKKEGLICLLMFIPLALPMVALGAAIAWLLFHKKRLARARSTAALSFLIVATSIAFEPLLHTTHVPLYAAADSIVIDGTQEEIWNAMVALSDVPKPDDLFFRSGIATPQKTKIVTCAAGGLRVCTLSTGTLLERIDVWQPGVRLGWRALSTPPPMKELNPFGDADPPHLHGTYRNVRGEFALERVDTHRTRVTRRTWYEHDLYPSWYWRIWCDLGASKVHHLVLEHLRRETERRRGGMQV
jgi:hypothetical protein